MNKALKTLYVYNGVFIFASHLLGPLYAVFVEGIDERLLAISLSWAIFMVSTTFFTLLVGKYGDKIREKEYLLLAGYLVRALVWILYIFIQDFNHLILLQVLLGFGEALGTPAFDAIFAEHLDNGKHIADYANWKIISNILGAMAVVVGGLIVKFSEFNMLFLFMACLAVICFFGVLFKPRELL